MFKVYLCFVLLLLLWLSSRLITTFYRSIQSYSWPLAEGVVKEAKIVDYGPSRMGAGKPRNTFGPSITYEYIALTKVYEGSRIGFFSRDSSTSPDSFDDLLAAYQKGAKIKVYYDPENPSEAILKQGLTIGALFAALAMMAFFASVLYMIFR